MQYLVAINQTRALEWGLNAQQAMLFAFLHQVPTWAKARQIDGQTFFNISKTKVVDELPLLTDKPDTAYRLMKQLAKAGLIVMTSCDNKTYIRLTEKAIAWNRVQGSEKNPTPENSPSPVGKKSDPGSEKSPTNQGTNDPTPPPSDAGESSGESIFEQAARRTDDGTPAPSAFEQRQHPMGYGWQPDPEQLAMACYRRGLPTDTAVPTETLADFTAHFAEKPTQRLTGQGWHERLAKWLAENRQRQPLTPNAPGNAAQGDRHADRRAADTGRDQRTERQLIADQLSNPNDTSWADGWWPEDDTAAGADAGSGQPGVHSAGGDFSEDLGERVPECGPAQPGPSGAGAGAGPVAGTADPASGRAGDERPEAGGEYLAADDPGAGLDAGAYPGGFRHAGDW